LDGLVSASALENERSETMNQAAARIDNQHEFIERSVAEQLALNRAVVAAADDEGLRDRVYPMRWERRGCLQRLRRQSGISKVT
jgi:hypothetical protein